MSTHTCHAKGCPVPVPPRLLMCSRHWRRVPAELKRRVWLTYRRGQEITKDPSPEYLEAMNAAIAAVAELEESV
jgi:diadenosine tetraphosphatase ApaH/serine/threonine PP2A family protein phosphatase